MQSSFFPASVIAALVLVRSLEAATIYSNLQDIALPANFAGVYLDIDTGATSTSAFSGWDINPFFGGVGISNSAAFQPGRVGSSNLDAILKLNVGTLISGSLTFATGIGGSGNAGHEHIGASANQFQVGTEGYLGFKFTKNDNSGPYFGWMRVVLTNNSSGALIKDWGYDSVSGGTIVAGRVQQSAASAGAQTVTLSPGTGESFTLGSALTDTGGNTNSLVKTGAGATTLGTANTFTGTTTVSTGTLHAGTANALGSTASVAVNTGGTLLLSGSGDRINNSAAVTLAGGTFNTAGLSETVGALTLTTSSVIDFAAGASASSLLFAASAGAWTGTLSIYNWTASTDHLFFGSSSSGLNVSQLRQISFYSGAGSGFIGTGGILSTGEIVPIPEPSSLLTATAMLALIAGRESRRRRCHRRA